MKNSRRQVLIGIAGASALATKEHPPITSTTSNPPPAPPRHTPPKSSTPKTSPPSAPSRKPSSPAPGPPGALDVKVHELIDESIANNKSAQATWRNGFAEVDALSKKLSKKSYSALEAGDRAAV